MQGKTRRSLNGRVAVNGGGSSANFFAAILLDSLP